MNARSLKTAKSSGDDASFQSIPESAAAPELDLRLEAPAAENRPLPVAHSPETISWMIAEAAYYKAERRDFAPGHETDDWLIAEKEILAVLRS